MRLSCHAPVLLIILDNAGRNGIDQKPPHIIRQRSTGPRGVVVQFINQRIGKPHGHATLALCGPHVVMMWQPKAAGNVPPSTAPEFSAKSRARFQMRCTAHAAAHATEQVRPKSFEMGGACGAVYVEISASGKSLPPPPQSEIFPAGNRRIPHATRAIGRADKSAHTRADAHGCARLVFFSERVIILSVRVKACRRRLPASIAAHRGQARHDAQRGLFGTACSRDRAKPDMPRNDFAVTAGARFAVRCVIAQRASAQRSVACATRCAGIGGQSSVCAVGQQQRPQFRIAAGLISALFPPRRGFAGRC